MWGLLILGLLFYNVACCKIIFRMELCKWIVFALPPELPMSKNSPAVRGFSLVDL